ncbi:YlxR family protein [Candidatus Electronema sp. JC]|uniref:YlxR family protein n=1 Tax=Candidatus Electronema sp. JC TaxID=3401570 RepID=UPI003AA88E74
MRRGHVPIRTCKGCGQKRPAAELIRLTLAEGGGLREDSGRCLPGRGVWCCPGGACRLRLEKNKKGLRRAFRL